jgi:hypothetical protein
MTTEVSDDILKEIKQDPGKYWLAPVELGLV